MKKTGLFLKLIKRGMVKMANLPNWIKWDKDKGKYILVKEVND